MVKAAFSARYCHYHRFQLAEAAGIGAQPLPMRTPDQYRELAAECHRLAAEAKNEAHEKILREMARA
jgi:hypothetical protein